jgi:hypothetical protein
MNAGDRKAAFRKLSSGHDLDDLSGLLGVSTDTMRAWHKPSNPRAPSEECLSRLRRAVIVNLTEQVRRLELDAVTNDGFA